MTADEHVDDLGRLAFRTAGQLRLLRERMAALDFTPDEYELPDVGQLADALHRMAFRCALSTGNVDLMSEVSGRQFRKRDAEEPVTFFV